VLETRGVANLGTQCICCVLMLNMNAYLCMTSCYGTHATEVIKLTYLLTWLVAWSDGCINEITLH